MPKFRTITVSRGPGGYNGPLTITPDEKHSKIAYIVGGGQKLGMVDRIAELTGAEAVNGLSTRVPDNEHFCVVIDHGGSLRCDLYPRRGVPTVNVVPTGKINPLAWHIRESIYVFTVGMDQVRPTNAGGAAGTQAAAATESAWKSVPTREDGRPMKLTGQMTTKQKKSLLERIELGVGKVTTVFYQADCNAMQIMINAILPFMGFVAMLINIIQASDLGDWFSHLLTPLAGSSWGLMALGLICSLPSLSPLLGPGVVITQIIGTLIGVKIGKGNILPRLSLPALFATNTQNICDFIPIGMGPGEAEPETIEVGAPTALYSRFLNDVPRVAIA